MGGYSCSTGNWPDFNAMLGNIWGAGQEFWSVGPCCLFGLASNFVFGQNPPYYLDDFLSVYPKFFGVPTALSGCVTTLGVNGSVVSVPSTAGLNYGQFVQSWGNFPKGTVIIGIGVDTITLNQAALVANSNATLMVYEAPPVPTAVIQLYINLAWNSLVAARWCDSWFIAMAWFVAHYLTLYAKSDSSEVSMALQSAVHGEIPVGSPPQPASATAYTISTAPPGGVLQSLTVNGVFQQPGLDYTLSGPNVTFTVPTPTDADIYATWLIQVAMQTTGAASGAQIAAQGLAGGIQTSKSVGDVSVGYQPLTSLEKWGQWNLTTYGQQLATMASVMGAGPSVVC